MSDVIEIFPPHGIVKLCSYNGTELDIVNAARVSFHKESTRLTNQDTSLIRYLLNNKHGSPFEFGFQSIWHIRLPIFVMREWVRHRIGHSINEESGRYVEMRSDFFEPDHLRVQRGKPGAYTFEKIEDESMYLEFLNDLADNNKRSWDYYQKWLKRGVAKEQARIFLPLNLYTEIRWHANARSLMHFLSLRNDRNAQYEIRKYAEALETIFARHLPVVHETFVANDRVAP